MPPAVGSSAVSGRWFSRRAMKLHVAVLIWVPACLIAGWWQVNRAFDGNGLSYLYSVEWPVFAIVGVWMWWSLIHTDPESVGARAQRRQEQAQARAGLSAPAPQRRREDEDEALAAYNDRLARLAAEDRPKTWRRSAADRTADA